MLRALFLSLDSPHILVGSIIQYYLNSHFHKWDFPVACEAGVCLGRCRHAKNEAFREEQGGRMAQLDPHPFWVEQRDRILSESILPLIVRARSRVSN